MEKTRTTYGCVTPSCTFRFRGVSHFVLLIACMGGDWILRIMSDWALHCMGGSRHLTLVIGSAPACSISRRAVHHLIIAGSIFIVILRKPRVEPLELFW